MKKLTAILIALTMLFAFAACSGGTPDEDDVRGEQVVNTTEATEPSDDVTDTPEADITDTPEIDVTDAPADDVTEPEFSLGDVEGLNYENKFIGIGCNLPSDWTFYTDEQIREVNNLAADMIGEDYKAALEKLTIFYDMYAASSDKLKNINVNLEKVNPITLAKVNLSDIYNQNIPVLRQSIENIGYTYVGSEILTVTIDGAEFLCLKTTAKVSDTEMNQIIFSKKCNGYLANIAVTAIGEDALEEIIDCFYLVK